MMLPVKYHSELLAKQYWLSCFQSRHPLNTVCRCITDVSHHSACPS